VIEGLSIETERLVLRPPRRDDFDSFAEFAADADAQRFLGGPGERSAAWRSFLEMAGAWALQGFAMFSVIERETGDWVGRVGPWCPEGWPGTEIGWSIVRSRWGRGYATEAAAASIDWAFDELGWTEVIHCIDDGNEPSAAVARRLGSSKLRRALLPAPINVELDVWGQTRDEWRERQLRST
jgi:RimJ/RimL family protein N-acetyltransferase